MRYLGRFLLSMLLLQPLDIGLPAAETRLQLFGRQCRLSSATVLCSFREGPMAKQPRQRKGTHRLIKGQLEDVAVLPGILRVTPGLQFGRVVQGKVGVLLKHFLSQERHSFQSQNGRTLRQRPAHRCSQKGQLVAQVRVLELRQH
jgi:hypothetical protein